jgi:hypothetical protein
MLKGWNTCKYQLTASSLVITHLVQCPRPQKRPIPHAAGCTSHIARHSTLEIPHFRKQQAADDSSTLRPTKEPACTHPNHLQELQSAHSIIPLCDIRSSSRHAQSRPMSAAPTHATLPLLPALHSKAPSAATPPVQPQSPPTQAPASALPP